MWTICCTAIFQDTRDQCKGSSIPSQSAKARKLLSGSAGRKLYSTMTSASTSPRKTTRKRFVRSTSATRSEALTNAMLRKPLACAAWWQQWHGSPDKYGPVCPIVFRSFKALQGRAMSKTCETATKCWNTPMRLRLWESTLLPKVSVGMTPSSAASATHPSVTRQLILLAFWSPGAANRATW